MLGVKEVLIQDLGKEEEIKRFEKFHLYKRRVLCRFISGGENIVLICYIGGGDEHFCFNFATVS